MSATRTTDLLLPSGTLAQRPLPQDVPEGALYPSLDTQIVYRNSEGGAGWEDWLVIADMAPGTDAEAVRDIVGMALQAGTGITVNVDDAGETITIGATGGVDIEAVRDAVAATLVAGSNVTITPDDVGDTITISASGGGGGGGGGGTYAGAWTPGTYPAGSLVRHNGYLFGNVAETDDPPALAEGTDYGTDFAAVPVGVEAGWFYSDAPVAPQTVTSVAKSLASDPSVTTALRLFGAGTTGSALAIDLTLTFDVDGHIEFWDSISSENGWDWADFHIDDMSYGNWKHHISGEQPYTFRTYPVTAGTHTFRWRFGGDGSAGGQDSYWITRLRTTGSVFTNPPPYAWDALAVLP